MFERIPDVNWNLLAPVIAPGVTGIVALILEMMRPKKTNELTVWATIIGLAISAVMFGQRIGDAGSTTLAGAYKLDSFGCFIGILIAASSILTVLFSEDYLRAKRIPFGEFYALLAWSAFGGMVMACSTHLITLFVGLEVLSIAIYVLASLSRGEEKSQESGLKYFLLGAFASSFLLYGMAFFYGATGSMLLEDVTKVLASGDPTGKLLIVFGSALMLVGLGFKCGFVPFHQWTPDVY